MEVGPQAIEDEKQNITIFRGIHTLLV